MGSKTIAAAFVCLVGIAAGAGCYCSCCNWIWCDNCQKGCCQGSRCSTPNCRNPGPPPLPPTPPPPTPAEWQYLGTGCCPDNTCKSNTLFFGQSQLGHSQLASRNVTLLVPSLRMYGSTMPPTVGVMAHAIAPRVIRKAIASATRKMACRCPQIPPTM